MDEKNLKSNSCETKIEDSNKHWTSDPVKNLEKLKAKTKNGLVNGVREDKFKHNKKQSKTSINRSVKETKKNKSDGCVSLQKSNNCLDSLATTINDQIINNATPATDKSYDETKNSNCTTKVEKKEISQTKTSQSNLKETTACKKVKNKSKVNKSDKNELAKFDLASLVNLNDCSTSEKLIPNSELPSTSKACGSHNQHLLDYPDASEFERNLIESIKNMKMHQECLKVEGGGGAEPKKDISEPEESTDTLQLPNIDYVQYESELQMPMIMKIIQKDLSEPYSIYTYRYFIHNWPKLCFLAMCEEKCVGAIVCKLDFHRKSTKRGYIAMLAVDKDYRKQKIGSTLVRRAITEMIAGGADEVVLETEVTNKPALRLYEQLGFVRDKRLFRYYLNGVDALRLKLWLR